jgi:O-antigen ligase
MRLTAIALTLVVIVSGLTDAVRRINLGPFSGLGGVTIIVCFISWILVLTRTKISKRALGDTYLFVLFIALCSLSWIWNLSNAYVPVSDSLQNILVFYAFAGCLLLSHIEGAQDPVPSNYIGIALSKATQLATILYLVSISIQGPGAILIMGPRSYASFAIVGVALFLAEVRYSLPEGKLWMTLIGIATAMSLSRMAIFIMVIQFIVSRMSLKNIQGLIQMIVSIVLVGTVFYLAFTFVAPIRDRFTAVGDNATVGNVPVNTSGRQALWTITSESALKSPLIGQGPGSITTVLSETTRTNQPHNDYLRILHDYGVIGLVIWSLGYGALLIKTCLLWLWSDEYDQPVAHIHLAAFLALVAVALLMITDNVMIYLFAMAPLGVLTGASLGIGYRRKKLLKSAQKLKLAQIYSSTKVSKVKEKLRT